MGLVGQYQAWADLVGERNQLSAVVLHHWQMGIVQRRSGSRVTMKTLMDCMMHREMRAYHWDLFFMIEEVGGVARYKALKVGHAMSPKIFTVATGD